jgi:diguanylate cyclase
MDTTRDSARPMAGARSDLIPAGASAPAMIAKAALRRLALSKAEPTPENYARAYAEEAGGALPATAQALRPAPALPASTAEAAGQGPAWAQLIERIVRGVERGSKQWTTARKKDSLQRVLEGSRSDAQRLQQRLRQLLAGWESEGAPDVPASDFAPLDDGDAGAAVDVAATIAATQAVAPPAVPSPQSWQPLVRQLETTVQSALPPAEPRAQELADALARLAGRIAAEGATADIVEQVASLCERARRLLAHRHHLLDSLVLLCQELAAGLTELSEDESWARGQCEALQARLVDAGSVRAVRAATELLLQTRARQHQLRGERDAARDALKAMIQRMLAELGTLSQHTGRFHESVGRYAEVVERADSLESLAGAVREMVEESRTVQSLVSQTQERLNTEHSRATELEAQVRALEGELRRLSDEVSTDALTQIANRRGLMQAFDVERAKLEREGGELSVGLLDIDNFKKLNDTLGHAAGDEALKWLASSVSASLRPGDRVARYGGEEFVVVLPATAAAEGQQVLTRLQRALSESVFLHNQQRVFVTFSAGVTGYRAGERLEDALERADEALYEAKRSGKNRTCLG